MIKVFWILVLIVIIGIIKLFITGRKGRGILAILFLVLDFCSCIFISEVLSIISLIVLAIFAFASK